LVVGRFRPSTYPEMIPLSAEPEIKEHVVAVVHLGLLGTERAEGVVDRRPDKRVGAVPPGT
jgi:hypothetical protein